MMAYEKASGKTLSEEQKSAATEELVTTGALADAVGKEDAESLMNEVKKEVIENDLSDADDIQDAITDAAKNYNITLTEEQMAQISSLMKNISQYDYDVKSLKQTLENLGGKASEEGFFSNLWTSVKDFFTGGSDNGDGGIINDTKDEILGENAITNSTTDASGEDTDEEEGGFWNKVTGFFKNLFGGSDDDEDESEEDSSLNENGENTEDSESGDLGGLDHSGDALLNENSDADGLNSDTSGDETSLANEETETNLNGSSDTAETSGSTTDTADTASDASATGTNTENAQ